MTRCPTYTVTYSGLTGPATAAHFHGPAAVGANAPPVLPIPATMLASPIKGDKVLTDAQAADLAAGKWYFNIHTAAHAPGEIRGQVMKK
jgi:CHRD domain